MSQKPGLLARIPKSACYDQIQQLRQHFGDEMTCTLLGLKPTAALGFKDQPSPAVRRLAYLLHRMTFPTGRPVNLFELLTCGKYDRIPQEMGPDDGDWSV